MTPFQVAKNYKSDKNSNLFKQYKELGINFTTIEIEKLLSEEIISDGQMKEGGLKKKVERKVKIDPELAKMTGNLFLHYEER